MGDPKFRGIEYKVGLFIIVALLIVVVTILTFAIKSDLLTKKVKVIIYSNSGESLKKGMPVIYSGFQISRVDSVVLEDDGRVKLTVGIPIDYTKWIKSDSKAKLVSQNFIGSATIVFTGGSPNKRRVESGHEFYLIRDTGIDELIKQATPVMDDVKIIVKNLRILSDEFADNEGDFSKLMKMIGQVSEGISEKETSLGIILRTKYLTDHVDKLAKDIEVTQTKVNKLINKVDKLVLTVQNRVDDAEDTLPLVNENLKQSKLLMKNIELKLKDLDPILKDVKEITANVSDSTQDLRLLRDQAELMMDTTYELMLKTNNMWPFNSKEKGELQLKLP